jgi:hypothetical protein
MKLIDKTDNIKYYEGFDVNKMRNHPKDGSKGMMIIFFDSLEKEQLKYERGQKISNILNDTGYTNFEKLIDSFTNNYLVIYETSGYMELIYRSIRNKMETPGMGWEDISGVTSGNIPT